MSGDAARRRGDALTRGREPVPAGRAARPRRDSAIAGRPLVLVVLALAGVAVSSILAAFQLGVTRDVWDPIFGDGSRTVLTSSISRALPVPDALLGAAAYAVDALLGVALVLGLGRSSVVATALAALASIGAVVAIGLALAQPLVAHAGCALCLVSTAISVALAIGAITEAREWRHAGNPQHLGERQHTGDRHRTGERQHTKEVHR